ncbi:uncharacterized protein DUF4037 [Thermosporothrix hazakensis]|jgi:predicted nucleotidyltransferase|uniref:Uncharacterized protein DUF4037 n=2 Tax=Thermosporothrix TaxID=768650 RepID=A0A326U2P3_THEHA|nr:nucleotidyltransferase domain-containing protein [Thermosporothrix hazakensis]PZW24893.1 uncharacterized protein DUF4037 [Thermosporothrix hazakensis]BBH88234.1 hypothetical protein KTC_29850 [Thermosporothrix sp. COM3]GCE46419.1 hypothetical protein KTH_12880 [Thermosporothrix hazakensis]
MQQEALLQQIVQQLKDVRGVRALVLGGSFARGTQRPDSDLDIGIYYVEQQPPDIEHIRAIAASLNDTPDPVVTEVGEWGPWVNGGAWLTIQGQRVDFLYRDIDKVMATLDDCNAGIVISDYWQQPAYGFHNFMYCTETAICRPLYDPEHILERLKVQVEAYPPKLKASIIRTFLWSAQFSLRFTEKAAAAGNVYMVAGCLARAIHCLVQVLYALNETFYLSEKTLAHDLAAFQQKPQNMLERIEAILGSVGTASELPVSCKTAEALYAEVAALAEGQ